MYMNEELIQEKLEEMNATKIQKLDSQMYLVNFDLKEDILCLQYYTGREVFSAEDAPVFHGTWQVLQ